METDSCNKLKKGGISMNGDNHETAIELTDRIKAAADELHNKKNSPHEISEIRLQICQLTRRLRKKLECVREKIG